MFRRANCVVGRDANNHIFPIAWAVVCVENKTNWKWFLENLKDDLHLEDGFGLSLMSDQHKVCHILTTFIYFTIKLHDV